MRSVNKVILVGNLTRDPEMRQTPNGQFVTTFGVATNREWVTTEGDRKQSAEFHEAVAWARLAEICNQFLKKGDLVYIEGYLKTRSWDSPEGVKKFKTEVVVQDMIRLEKRDKDGGDSFAAAAPQENEEVGEEVSVEEEAEIKEGAQSGSAGRPRSGRDSAALPKESTASSGSRGFPLRAVQRGAKDSAKRDSAALPKESTAPVGIDTDLGL